MALGLLGAIAFTSACASADATERTATGQTEFGGAFNGLSQNYNPRVLELPQ